LAKRTAPTVSRQANTARASTKEAIAPMAVTGSIRSTRHHRVDHRFLELLEEDFGIPEFALSHAFMGFPAEPKKSAIALCEWASRTDDPARALLAWARKNHRGTFRLDVAGVEH
jgi:hypothetical protein